MRAQQIARHHEARGEVFQLPLASTLRSTRFQRAAALLPGCCEGFPPVNGQITLC
jgi:hypothetical protein